MSRSLTAALKAEFLAADLRPIWICEIALADGTYVRVWTGYGTLSWDSKSWDGVGTFGGVSDIAESIETVANGIKLTLSGIPSGMLADALDDLKQGRSVKLWLGALNASGAVIADPYTAFVGRTDAVDIDEGGDTSTIEVACESELIDLRRPRESRYTNEDQKARFAGDLGFEYVPQLQELNIMWGSGPAIPQTSSSYAGGDSAQRGSPDTQPIYD